MERRNFRNTHTLTIELLYLDFGKMRSFPHAIQIDTEIVIKTIHWNRIQIIDITRRRSFAVHDSTVLHTQNHPHHVEENDENHIPC